MRATTPVPNRPGVEMGTGTLLVTLMLGTVPVGAGVDVAFPLERLPPGVVPEVVAEVPPDAPDVAPDVAPEEDGDDGLDDDVHATPKAATAASAEIADTACTVRCAAVRGASVAPDRARTVAPCRHGWRSAAVHRRCRNIVGHRRGRRPVVRSRPQPPYTLWR